MKRLQIWVITLILISGYVSADEPPTDNNNKIVINLNTSEVSVSAFVEPIAFIRDNLRVPWDALNNLQASEPEKRHAASVFRAFLPNEPVSVGALWRIEPQDGILALLKQLHPNPQMIRGDSKGAWACLRAYNAEFAEIVFRIHAQFVLEPPQAVFKDSWLTPSQFAGKLVIERNRGRIAFFEMRVPQRTINFNVSWTHEDFNNIVYTESAFCQRMELIVGAANDAPEFAVNILEKEAEHKLILQFYKSQQINWVLMDEALEVAKTLQKPIHVVSVDVPLDDESCWGTMDSLRGDVLSNDRNIEFLNANFINTWVLNVDLNRLRDLKGIEAIHPLARTIIQGWQKDSFRDCLIISPELQLLGRQRVNELSPEHGGISTNYNRFLVEALGRKFPGLGVVVLNADRPTTEVIHIFRTPEAGYQDYTPVEIDATAFENGGTLTIHIQVGSAEAAGSFNLFDGNRALPTKGIPDDVLAFAWDVPPGESGEIVYLFSRGRRFKLGATGNWFSEKGSVNAFRAVISVEPISDQ
jgi:hypothetical protein